MPLEAEAIRLHYRTFHRRVHDDGRLAPVSRFAALEDERRRIRRVSCSGTLYAPASLTACRRRRSATASPARRQLAGAAPSARRSVEPHEHLECLFEMRVGEYLIPTRIDDPPFRDQLRLARDAWPNHERRGRTVDRQQGVAHGLGRLRRPLGRGGLSEQEAENRHSPPLSMLGSTAWARSARTNAAPVRHQSAVTLSS
jgi:hypothetical protein